MKQFSVLGICLALFLCGCSGCPVKTSLQTEAYLEARPRLQRNMTPQEVIELMGNPDRPITIYFYLEGGENNFFSRFSKDNYTPLVFVNNKLAGWGWNYLNGAVEDIIND